VPQKVWDIGSAAALARRSDVSIPTPNPTSTATPSPDLGARPSPKRRWSRVIAAYAAGWLALPFWCTGRERILWTILGCGSAVGVLSIASCWPRFTTWLETMPQGNVLFLAFVPTLVLVLGMSWTRAVAVATRRRAAASPAPSGWQHDSWVVALLGLIVPGLGLLVTGHPRRAALAFALLGPFAASAVVLTNASWLWRRSQSEVAPGLAGPSLELCLIAAATVAACAVLVWIVQALDGARLASHSVGTRMPQALSALLLASLALFTITTRPAAVARNLHGGATQLQEDGYQWIPLTLCELAMRVDSAPAAYLATGAELDDALGRTDAAAAKRLTIAARAQEYGAFVPGGAARAVEASSADGSDPWSRLARLAK
jgi:hypothetical protein